MKKSKKKKKSNTWKIKQHRDQFFKKSKTLGYRSRASFKLIELNQKFKFIKKNSRLLDLGSYPGGWSQVASKLITNGKILAIDIKSMEQIKNVKFLKYDILKQDIKEKRARYIRAILLKIVLHKFTNPKIRNQCCNMFEHVFHSVLLHSPYILLETTSIFTLGFSSLIL